MRRWPLSHRPRVADSLCSSGRRSGLNSSPSLATILSTQKLSHNNFSVRLSTQPARNPADTSWSREVKLDREVVESSSHASGYNLVSPRGVIFTRRTVTLRSRLRVSHEQGLDPGLFVFPHPG